MALLRSATTRAASSSESAPDTQAAAISPWEWPTTASGSTPCARHRAASDTITENSTGWTTSTRSRPGAPGAPRRTSVNDQSVYGARASAHFSTEARKTSEVSSSSSAMPSHCEPWPGKTKTVRAGRRTRPRTRPGAGRPCARASSPVRNSCLGPATSTARCSIRSRVAASE